MENFFEDDKFHSDLESLMSDHDLNEDEDIKDLDDDWHIDCEGSSLEKIFVLTEDSIVNSILGHIDRWEDRFPAEDYDDRTSDSIHKAIRQGIDIVKMNSLIPELYYPNGKKFKITKKDLLEYINP